MKYSIIFSLYLLTGLFLLTGCQEETLVAEVPQGQDGITVLTPKFVSVKDANSMIHRWAGEDLTFELLQGKNADENINAAFDTDESTLETMTAKFATLKGVNVYKLLEDSYYDLPVSIQLKKGQRSVNFQVKLKDVPDGTFVLPLVLKKGGTEIGVQYIEIVKNAQVTDLDMNWLDRVPSVAEPRFVASVEAAENDLRNLGNYMLYPEGLSRPELKRPLFDMTVIFSANMNYDEGAAGPVLFYNEDVKKILDNRDVFVKPLQDKGIKVLLSVLPNHQGIGFSNMDITGDRAMIKNFAKEIYNAIQKYGLDGVMLDDEYANYPGGPEAEQPGRPMIQMGSFHFLVKELRDLMPVVEGQAWKDRHNLLTLYNIGPCSNSSAGERKWALFSNRFEDIKNGDNGWSGRYMTVDKTAVQDWVKNPENQGVLDEIAQIKVGELFDFVWNANYSKGDNYNFYMSGNSSVDSWIAGMDQTAAVDKYGTASFEMSLQLSEYGYVEHKPEYWLKQEWPDPSRIESLEKTLGKQLDNEQKTILVFNMQYVPESWKGSGLINPYLENFPYFMKKLGNKKQPVVQFEGTNYDTLISSYLR